MTHHLDFESIYGSFWVPNLCPKWSEKAIKIRSTKKVEKKGSGIIGGPSGDDLGTIKGRSRDTLPWHRAPRDILLIVKEKENCSCNRNGSMDCLTRPELKLGDYFLKEPPRFSFGIEFPAFFCAGNRSQKSKHRNFENVGKNEHTL